MSDSPQTVRSGLCLLLFTDPAALPQVFASSPQAHPSAGMPLPLLTAWQRHVYPSILSHRALSSVNTQAFLHLGSHFPVSRSKYSHSPKTVHLLRPGPGSFCLGFPVPSTAEGICATAQKCLLHEWLCKQEGSFLGDVISSFESFLWRKTFMAFYGKPVLSIFSDVIQWKL